MWTGFLIRSTHRLNKRIFFKGNWAVKSNLQSEYLWLKYEVQYLVEKHKRKYVCFFRDHIQSVMLQNAAKIRHRVSTIHASLDIAASDREIYLQHMSHSHYVSKENYICPPGKRELEVMTQIPEDIAKGTFDL